MEEDTITDKERIALLIASNEQMQDISDIAKAIKTMASYAWRVLDNGEIEYSQERDIRRSLG